MQFENKYQKTIFVMIEGIFPRKGVIPDYIVSGFHAIGMITNI